MFGYSFISYFYLFVVSVYSIVDTDEYTDGKSDEHSEMESDDDNSEYLPSSDNKSIVSDSDMSEVEVPPIPDVSIHLQEEIEPTPTTSNMDKEESSLCILQRPCYDGKHGLC